MAEITDLLGFEQRAPAHQNALDLFSGAWGSLFPPSSGLTGGSLPHFDDVRVTWAASVMGGLNGLSILELGPFEAYNTYQFQLAGASAVISLESSKVNFLKCLIVKNIFNLNATFLLGDFQEYLSNTRSHFDVCWASGILYHMTKPIELLKNIRRIADTAFIWTHYYDADTLIRNGNAEFFDESRDKFVEFGGRSLRLHYRSYLTAAGVYFSGGEANYSYWIERDDIMFVLEKLGYDNIQIGIDNPDHPPGPAMFFLARTTRASDMLSSPSPSSLLVP